MVGPEEGLEVGLLDVEGIMVGDIDGLAVGIEEVEGPKTPKPQNPKTPIQFIS